ncbi:MAG: hypothetical protein WDO13_19815 [Verrucomicrobiota bacterium]
MQVASIDLDVFKGELHIAGISLTNQRPDQPWDKGGIAQATVRYHLADLLAPTMPVTVEVTSWSVVLHSPLRTAETPPAASADPGAETGTGGTSHRGRIRVTHLAATDGTVEFDFSDDRRVTMRGVAFDAADNGAGVWTTQVQASSIKSPTLDLGASSVQIRGDANTITFTDLRLQCPPGAITGDGDVATASPHDMHLNLKAVDLPMAMLVSVGWQQELAGLVTLDVHYTGNDQGGGAQGSLSVAHGKFSVLPWLGKVTSLVGLQDITGVEVDKATTDFQWQNGTLLLTHLDVRKNDVARIAGKVDISPQNQVDGRLRLGLPSLSPPSGRSCRRPSSRCRRTGATGPMCTSPARRTTCRRT